MLFMHCELTHFNSIETMRDGKTFDFRKISFAAFFFNRISFVWYYISMLKSIRWRDAERKLVCVCERLSLTNLCMWFTRWKCAQKWNRKKSIDKNDCEVVLTWMIRASETIKYGKRGKITTATMIQHVAD